jgi:hypothetical protein
VLTDGGGFGRGVESSKVRHVVVSGGAVMPEASGHDVEYLPGPATAICGRCRVIM